MQCNGFKNVVYAATADFRTPNKPKLCSKKTPTLSCDKAGYN